MKIRFANPTLALAPLALLALAAALTQPVRSQTALPVGPQFWQTNGSGDIYKVNARFVGIGTDTPQADLDVYGVTRTGLLQVWGTLQTNSFVLGGRTTPGYVLTTDVNGIGSWQAPVNYWTLSGNNLSNNNSGAVGIGTNAPTQKLSVIGDALVEGTQGYNAANETARLYLGDTNASVRAVWGSGLRLSAYNAQDGLVLQESTGNVGIGIATPTYKLDVDAGTAVSSARFVTNRVNGSGLEAFSYATTGTGYGVVGACLSNSTGYGLYSIGRTGATGTKSFRIDHPLDPENKYLMHYCAEGPEPRNVYQGSVRLDANGEAWVELPDYFADINRDPQYQLTAVGASMPGLHVAQEVSENRFLIAGGVAGGKVSWRVEGVRNDRWVRQYGAPVEVEKSETERGTYQHPELYGQPKEKGAFYRAEPASAKAGRKR